MRRLQESTSPEFWDGVLGLGELEVVHYVFDVEQKVRRMTVVPRVLAGVCPDCQQACDHVHQTRDREHIHDLPIGERAVELRVRVPQFWCETCEHPFTPVFPSLVTGTHATERFLERCAELIRVSDVANAAKFFRVAEKNLERWYYEYVSRRQAQPTQPAAVIRSLGIDELSQKKGRGFVAVIIDHTNGRVLEVLENREKQTVLTYLKSAKASGLLAQVEEVTTDMWTAYVEAAREAFGQRVRITVDRFHVMKGFQEQLNAARRQLQRSLPADAAKALKGMRWLLLKNWEHLTAEEREELAEIKRLYPELGQLHDLRESFRRVFESRARSVKAGRHRLRMWIAEARRLGTQSLERFCQTLEHWMDSIVNYFVTRASNGQTEGFNHKLRGILWRAFGMPNFKHFRFRILDACGVPRTLEST